MRRGSLGHVGAKHGGKALALQAGVTCKLIQSIASMSGEQRELSLRFLAEPTDANYRGKVHGGVVMRMIDAWPNTRSR